MRELETTACGDRRSELLDENSVQRVAWRLRTVCLVARWREKATHRGPGVFLLGDGGTSAKLRLRVSVW